MRGVACCVQRERVRGGFRTCRSRLLAGVVLAYVGVCAMSQAISHIDPYDGSYNAMLARNLAFEGRYGLWDYGRYVTWPVEVTTGPALLLPVAAAYRLAGDGPFVANVVCASVVMALLVATWTFVVAGVDSRASAVSALVALGVARDDHGQAVRGVRHALRRGCRGSSVRARHHRRVG